MNRDAYQTPREVFAPLHAEFNFALDVCASTENALLPHYITEQENCLTADWCSFSGQLETAGWYSWMNPPYSDIGPFVKRAAEMATKGVGTVMLVMMDQSVGWYKEAIKTCQEVRLVIGGRLSFIDPSTGKPAAGNNKGSMFLIWHPFGRTKVQYSHIERDELLAAGRELLAQGLPEQNEPLGNSEELADPELSRDALQLPDHIADAGVMVGTHINEVTKVCDSHFTEFDTQQPLTSENGEQTEQIATKCVEESGTDTNDGTKTITIHTVEYTSEEIADQLTSGKLPFSGDHLALMLQLDGMFGKQYSYTTSQIRAAILAFDEPGMVTKGGEVVAAVAQVDDTYVVELTEEQDDLFEHFDAAMTGAEPVPEQEAEPASVANAALPAQSDDAEIYFDVLGIPQNLREMFERCDQTDIERSGYAVWSKGKFAPGKLNGIGIRSGGNFKSGFMYEPVLVVYHNGQAAVQHESWPAALAELERLLREAASAAVPMGAEHPFFTGFYNGHACYEQTVKGKLEMVKNFTLEQCQIALNIPLSHNSVRSAIEARIRKLQKEQAAA